MSTSFNDSSQTQNKAFFSQNHHSSNNNNSTNSYPNNTTSPKISEESQQNQNYGHNNSTTFNLRTRAQREIEDLQSQPLPYSSDYYQDLTREKYDINLAFQSNNFNSIRGLPNSFQHRVILDGKKERVEKAKDPSANTPQGSASKSTTTTPKVVKLIGGGYFSPFVYTDEVYGFAKEINRFNQLRSLAKRMEISETDFKYADKSFSGKWEDPFRNKSIKYNHASGTASPNSSYIFPSYVPGDTYDALQESITRQRLISAAHQLAGDFIPSKNQATLHKLSKANLQEIIAEIQFILEADWPESKFLVAITSDDLIDVVFKTPRTSGDEEEDNDDPTVVISVYMNALLNDERITPFGLSKHVPDWSKVNPSQATISFSFKPPWVKSTNVDSFYQLHPELVPPHRKNVLKHHQSSS